MPSDGVDAEVGLVAGLLNRGSMTAWTDDALAGIGRASELQIASRRIDGSLRPFVTIWGARLGDDLYIRSAHGPENGWFRRRPEG